MLTAARELRHRELRGRWIVETFPGWEPHRATRLCETSKAEALDLADATAASLGEG